MERGKGEGVFLFVIKTKMVGLFCTPGVVHLWKAEDNAVLNHSAMHSIFADSVSLWNP